MQIDPNQHNGPSALQAQHQRVEINADEWDETQDEQQMHGAPLFLVGSFSHQVAGHGAILKASQGKICKPLADRELWFYRSLATNPQYRPFVPRWAGCFHIAKEELARLVEEEEEQHKKSIQDEKGLQVMTWGEKVYHDLEAHLRQEAPGLIHRTCSFSLPSFFFEE